MFCITATVAFRASHQIQLYDGSLEPLHEHLWKVKVTVRAAELDRIGVVMDFHELERRLRDVTGALDGRRLNDLAAFATMNPSAENVALHIAREVSLPDNVRLESVEVWETAENSAVYRA